MKEFLTKKGLQFEVKDVYRDEAAQQDMMAMGVMSIPITRVDGGPPIVGADFARIEAAGLDPEQEAKLEQELRRQYHILTRDDRLDTVAKDAVRHFLGRGFVGKAMVVSIDKATALRMHDKVRAEWATETARVERELAKLGPTSFDNRDQKDELERRLDLLRTTDMALIVSQGQNEIAEMRELGLDIEGHRRRMNESRPGLDERFKDTADPLRLVFVCAMWLTGFDAPSCSTVYLDKPMRNHTLMQTIARANRVFPGKHSGVIVDYANVFASLEQALAIYGAGRGGSQPVKDKQKLVGELREALAEATTFCGRHGVRIADIEALPQKSFQLLSAIGDAVNALIGPDEVRREFMAHDRVLRTLYGAVKPDPAALEFSGRIACLGTIADDIRTRVNPEQADISAVLGGIGRLLDESIAGVEVRDQGPPPLNLSKINFEALASRFKESKQKNIDLESLKAAVRARLEKMVEVNRTRANFTEQFEQLIESYNSGSRSIEELFQSLLELSRSLGQEEQRHVRESLSEEELVIFDILTRPAPELSAAERDEVKKVARELLVKLKSLLVLDWRKTVTARARMRLAIEDTLDTGLPRAYGPELYGAKCEALFEHVYEAYPNRGQGAFGVA